MTAASTPFEDSTLPLTGVVYVGFWRRTAATIVDSLLLLICTLPPLILIYGFSYLSTSDGAVRGLADVLLSWVLPAVAVIAFWVLKQATPGKMLVGARVVDAKTGRALSTGQAIVRYLAYFISTLPLCLGLIWVAFDRRKQGWHDKIAGTLVIVSPDDDEALR